MLNIYIIVDIIVDKAWNLLNLLSVSYKSCFSCQDEVDKDRSLNLRTKLQNHLEGGIDEVTSEECKEFIQVDEVENWFERINLIHCHFHRSA